MQTLGIDLGSSAIAKIIFNGLNPSGKLSTSIPQSVGQLPTFNTHKRSERGGVLDEQKTPLYPFVLG